MKTLLLLCMGIVLIGCGIKKSEVVRHADATAELSYMQGVQDGIKLADEIRERVVKNEVEANALAYQRRTNWLATRPGRLKP